MARVTRKVTSIGGVSLESTTVFRSYVLQCMSNVSPLLLAAEAKSGKPTRRSNETQPDDDFVVQVRSTKSSPNGGLIIITGDDVRYDKSGAVTLNIIDADNEVRISYDPKRQLKQSAEDR